MMSFLRRCRWLALTLLLAAPGLGGTWLPLVHPCVSETSGTAGADRHHVATADHETAATVTHGPGVAAADAAGTHNAADTCHCIGACHAAAMQALGVDASAFNVFRVVASTPIIPAYHADPPTQRHLDRHPPATAPPVI